jgi:hypothetical protein
MYVYSGNCRVGDVGTPTPLRDVRDEQLYVGDIVSLATRDSFEICYFYGLSVVVSTKWTSYSDGTHKINDTPEKFFIMGIKDVDFMKEDSGWHIRKVKSYKDVIDGEYWSDFGFNYREENE